jgi:hypothetical protein
MIKYRNSEGEEVVAEIAEAVVHCAQGHCCGAESNHYCTPLVSFLQF